MSYVFFSYANIRGQGTTEYIILLAIALTLGLAILGVMNFFPSFTFSSQTVDSSKYWSGMASPIGIVDYIQTGGNLQFVIENRASTDLTISSIVFTSDTSYSASGLPITIPPGARKTLSASSESCSGHKVIGYDVVITYSTEQVSDLKQVGLKSLAVQCSD